MRRLIASAVLVFGALALVAAQSTGDVAIVASVKRSADSDPGMVIRSTPPGSYAAVKAPVLSLLTAAFGLSSDRIGGLPLPPQRYDIDVRPAPADAAAPRPTTAQVLQQLLRQRFGLVWHMERRDFPIYLLKLARADGRVGPDLRPGTCEGPDCRGIEEPDQFEGHGIPMSTLARALRIPSGRIVVDATGLTGTWDVTLSFAPLREAAADAPTIFTVLPDRLGLKLEASTTPLDVLVVDALHQPDEN